jgi:hypothetical protein
VPVREKPRAYSGFWGPLRHAFDTVRNSKGLLAATAFVDFLVALPPALYVLRQVHGGTAHRGDALELARRFDSDLMADLRARAPAFEDDLTALIAGSLFVFFFLRPFVIGAFVGAAAAARREPNLGQHAKQGGLVYWRFLLLAVTAGVAAYLLSVAAKPLLDQVDEWALVRDEITANRYRFVTNTVVFGAFYVVAMIFDYCRVGIRMHQKPGVLPVFVELGRSALFVLQHPAQSLLILIASLAIELGAVFTCGWLVQVADGGYFTTSAIVLLLVQVVVLLREAARLFHLAGAWQLRAAEAGDEPHAPAVVTPESDEPDVLRSPLPWNVR